MVDTAMLFVSITAGFGLINLFYFFRFFRFTKIPQPKEEKNTHPVSIVVCAKNQADNLEQLLPLLAKQNHPTFEFIVVNDGSTDHTEDLLAQYALKDQRLKVVTIQPNETFWGNKKYALTLGIKKAQYQRLLLTDADCLPCSNAWLMLMTAPIKDKSSIVLGYGGYQKRSGLLNALIRYETVMTACQYLGHARAGMPYMGVGRNMAYATALFYEQNGFASHMAIPSGDDDLFVNNAAKSDHTHIVVEPEAHTRSIPETTWSAFVRQKRRHITTAHHYKWQHQWVLGLYALSIFGFWMGTALSLTIGAPLYYIFGVLTLRIGLQYALLAPCFKVLKEKSLTWMMVIFEPLLLCFQLIIFILNLSSNPQHWK